MAFFRIIYQFILIKKITASRFLIQKTVNFHNRYRNEEFVNIWDFIQNQVLGMKWLNQIIGTLLTKTGVDISSRIGGSIQFFLYDVI